MHFPLCFFFPSICLELICYRSWGICICQLSRAAMSIDPSFFSLSFCSISCHAYIRFRFRVLLVLHLSVRHIWFLLILCRRRLSSLTSKIWRNKPQSLLFLALNLHKHDNRSFYFFSSRQDLAVSSLAIFHSKILLFFLKELYIYMNRVSSSSICLSPFVFCKHTHERTYIYSHLYFYQKETHMF